MKLLILVSILYALTAYAAEWEQVSSHEGFLNQYHTLSCDEVNQRILVGTFAGFRYYDIPSDQWFEDEIPGLFGTDKFAIKGCGTQHPDRIVLGCVTAQFLGYVYAADAEGDSLGKVYLGSSGYAPAVVRDVEVDQHNPGRIYACSWGDVTHAGSFIISTDLGETWQLTYPPDIPYGMTGMAIASNGDIYLGGDSPSIAKSVDSGISWTVITNGLPAGSWGQALATDPSDSQRVLYGTQFGLFETVNGGSSWNVVHSPYCYCVAFSPANPLMVAAGTDDAKVWISTDGGLNWSDETGNLPPEAESQDISGLAFSPTDGYLYAATRNKGIYRAETNSLSVANQNSQVNSDQGQTRLTVMPNPVFHCTTVGYSVNTMSDVSLDILDLSGRLVERVLQETVAAGFHTVSWNSAECPAGIYLVRLNSPSGFTQESMVVIR